MARLQIRDVNEKLEAHMLEASEKFEKSKSQLAENKQFSAENRTIIYALLTLQAIHILVTWLL